jgi:hypothetical protein
MSNYEYSVLLHTPDQKDYHILFTPSIGVTKLASFSEVLVNSQQWLGYKANPK